MEVSGLVTSTPYSAVQTTTPDNLPYGGVWSAKEFQGSVWICGDSNLVAKADTSNLGSWTLMNNGIPADGIMCLEFVSSSVIFAGGYSGAIYKTTDGGNSWNSVYFNASVTNFIDEIKFFDANHGMAWGDGLSSTSPQACLVTTDGGTTWTNNNTFITGTSYPGDVGFASPSFVTIAGYNKVSGSTCRGIWRSTDAGVSWSFSTVGTAPKDSVAITASVAFRDQFVGVASRNDSTIWSTSDGGITWQQVGSKLPVYFAYATFVNGTSLAVLGGAKASIAEVDLNSNSMTIYQDTTKNIGFSFIDFPAPTRGYMTNGAKRTFYSIRNLSAGSNPSAFNITFNVNIGVMKAAGIFDPNRDEVIVRGDFEHYVNPSYQDWLGNEFAMTHNAVYDSVYGITVQLNNVPPGTELQYKYAIIDTSNGQTSLSDQTAFTGPWITWEDNFAGPGPNGNRVYTLNTYQYQTPPTVYFDNMIGAVQTHQVTFQADMTSLLLSGFIKGSDTMSVRGSLPPLNWWSNVVMSPNATNPDIYHGTVTVSMPAGAILEYDFHASPEGLFVNSGNDTTKGNHLLAFPNHDTTLAPIDPAIYLLHPAPRLDWTIGISATSNGFTDSTSYAAVDTSATDGYDNAIDLPKPPKPPSNYVYVYFPHPEWGAILGPNFMTDVKHDTDMTSMAKVWTFVVATDHLNKQMTVALTGSNGIPSSYPMILRDMKTGMVSDIRVTPSYSYNAGTDSSRMFQLIVGTPYVSLSHTYNAGWNLIGLPAKTSFPAASSIFGSSDVYLYGYSNAGGYFSADTLGMGMGYWIGAASPTSAGAKGIEALGPVSLALNPGFNLISLPYPDSAYSKEEFSFTKGNVTVGLDSAASLGWVSPSLFSYLQTTGGYTAVNELSLWNGYWFAALDSNLTLIFNPPVNNVIPSAAKKNVVSNGKTVASVSDTNWTVRLTLQANGSIDRLGEFGVMPGAKSGFDARYDLPHPPNPPSSGSNYAYLAFPHPDWKSIVGSNFSSDFVPVGSSYSWKMIVGCTGGNSMGTLSWDSTAVPKNVSIELVDLGNDGQALDMHTSGSYRFSLNGTDSMLISAVLTGVSDRASVLPSKFALYQNYPNPFNPTTTIAYDLPKAAHVTLKIYDVLGEEVATLVDEQKDAGSYKAWFDGSRFASGVYFYRIEAGSFMASKKFVLMK